VYLYTRRQSKWEEVDLWRSPQPDIWGFGLSVSLADGALAVGSVSGLTILALRDGAGNWTPHRWYEVTGAFSDAFSWNVALSDRELVVAAAAEDAPKGAATPHAGIVHVLR
jgi:hypothetical protein